MVGPTLNWCKSIDRLANLSVSLYQQNIHSCIFPIAGETTFHPPWAGVGAGPGCWPVGRWSSARRSAPSSHKPATDRVSHWRRIRQKRRQQSSLLFGALSHLATRMIWRKVFGRTSILGWRWFGVVWTKNHPFFRNTHYAKCPFFNSAISLLNLLRSI